jgi:hypothetical protein
MDQDLVDGIDILPKEFKTIALNSIAQGQAIEPSVLEQLAPKVRRAKKLKATNKGFSHAFGSDDEAAKQFNAAFDKSNTDSKGAIAAPVPKGQKKRSIDEAEPADAEFLPKRKRGRPKKAYDVGIAADANATHVPFGEPDTTVPGLPREEEDDPAMANIQALTEQMRARARTILPRPPQ